MEPVLPLPCVSSLLSPAPHTKGKTWAIILDFFQQEFSSQTPPGGLTITSRDPKLLIKVESSSPREGSSKEFSIPSTSTWKGGSGGCLARLAQLGRDLHWIYCRFLEEKRPKRANQGVDAGIQGCRWDLPAFTGRGALRAGSGVPWIAASLCCWSGHCSEAAHGKRARQRGQKACEQHPPPLLPLGAGSAHGRAATPGMRDPAGSHRVRFLLPMKLPWELPLK